MKDQESQVQILTRRYPCVIIRRSPVEAAVTMVESALIFPVLFALVFAVFDVAWLIHQKMAISAAVRAGARAAAAVQDKSCNFVKGVARAEVAQALYVNGATDPDNYSDIQVTSLTDKEINLDANQMGYSATFINITVTKTISCFFCLWLPNQSRLRAEAVTRMENPWLCSAGDPFPALYGL